MNSFYSYFGKRGIDIVLSSVGAIVFLPAFNGIAL